MRLVRDHAELDVQLEGRLVRIDDAIVSPTTSRVVRCDSVQEARAVHDEEVAAALAAGYVEAPDPVVDDEARLVHADELQLRGDPVGELIAIMRELEGARDDPRQRTRAEHRMAALVDEHHDRWLGELGRHVRKPTRKSPQVSCLDIGYRLGFAETVTLRGTRGIKMEEAYALLRRQPLSRQIRTLALGTPWWTDDFAAIMDALLEHGLPSRLRELVVGSELRHRELVTRWGDLPAIVEGAQSLETLRTFGGHGTLTIASPTLRTLEVGLAGDADLQELERASLPALEHLIVGSGGTVVSLPLFALFPSLVHARLSGLVRRRPDVSILDELGPLPPRLETLALLDCALDDRDLAAIARHPKRYAHLKRLDLRRNPFSRTLAIETKRMLPALRTS